MRHDADVVIVGAGPSGCAAAITLRRRGYRVLMIDRATFPRDKPCGDYCDPGALAALDDLGCLTPVLHAGASPIGGMRIVAQDGTTIDPRFPAGGQGLLLRRFVLDAELVAAAAAAGSEVADGTPVIDVQIDAGRVNVQTRRGSRPLTAAVAIVCDGMHSAIVRRLGLLAGMASRRYTLGAYFTGLDGPTSQARGELHLGAGRYGGVARFSGGLANVCLALPRDALARRSAEQAFREGLRSFPRLADELSGARRESPYRASGPIGFRTNRMVAGRVMLAGDAAAQVDPMTGQGIFFALRSGMLAGETAAAALAAGGPTAARLDAYRRRRRAAFGPQLRAARLLQVLALRPHLTPWLIRRLSAHPHLASELVGVTGDLLPPSAILNAVYAARLLVGHRP